MTHSLSGFSVMVWRGIRRGASSVRRQRRSWAAAWGAFFGILVVVQMLLLLRVGIQTVAMSAFGQLEVRIQLRDRARDDENRALTEGLRALPEAQSVTFETREQQLDDVSKQDPNFTHLLDRLRIMNPFHDSFVVVVRSEREAEHVLAFVRSSPKASAVDPSSLSDASAQAATWSQEGRLLHVLGVTVDVLLALLVCVLFLLTVDSSRKRSVERKEEVLIERMAGASMFAIVLPFATEAAVLLLSAFFLSILLPIGLFLSVPTLAPSLFSGSMADAMRVLQQFLPLVMLFLFAAEAVLLLCIALGGAWWGLKNV